MALAKRNEGAKVSSEINVTPMVDVMLVLLIIFMVVTPMLQKGISVDMAKVNNPEQMPDADKEDALLVSIIRDGKSISAPTRSRPDNLTTKVKDRLANSSISAYTSRPNARPLRQRGSGSGAVRAAGVDDLGLLTEQKKNNAAAPPATPGASGNKGELPWEWQSARAAAKTQTLTSHRSSMYCWFC